MSQDNRLEQRCTAPEKPSSWVQGLSKLSHPELVLEVAKLRKALADRSDRMALSTYFYVKVENLENENQSLREQLAQAGVAVVRPGAEEARE